jgi:hypothetical protein
MAQAVEASEDRVQRSSDEVFGTMRAALEQSERNNRIVAERNVQLSERLIALESRNRELEATRQAEKMASDERIAALNEKVEVMMTRLSKLERNYSGHTHSHNFCCPHRPGINCSQTMSETSKPKEKV